MTSTNSVRRVQKQHGKEALILETGRMAKQADGAVVVTYGGTVVLVSAVVSQKPREGVNFMPLTVEFQEKTYAAGRIPGGFFRREGRPSEKAILTARLIDRPIRPLFPKGFRNDVQVIALVLSHDGQNDPDVPAMIGASAALGLAGAPMKHRVGAAKVGRVDGRWVLNPTYADIEQGDLELVVAATPEGVIMVEAGAKQISEAEMVEAIEFARKHALETIALQEELLAASVPLRRQFEMHEPDAALVGRVRSEAGDRIEALLASRVQKESVGEAQGQLVEALVSKLQGPEGEPVLEAADVEEAIEQIEREIVRRKVHASKQRMDGRDLTTVRPIACEVGVLPRTHGSALFTRGQTQSLSAATLGTAGDEQIIDALQGKWFKPFMLHYNFPPFSVGEVRPMRGTSRREQGHGALAEKAILKVMPKKETFPYTTRVVSEILESNGSSSMATVCAGTLALMDAGVPIEAPVAGIAMGLVREEGRHTILTDIIGLEDHYGDMDFKVAGTARGITALQLDLKLAGVPVEVLRDALEQAKPARALVLSKMLEALAAPRAELSPYAPRITQLRIDPQKIGELIGPGGKMIRKIIAESGASIDVEDDGTVMVASADPASVQKAIDFIKGLTEEAQLGRVYQGVVRRITNFGAFFEIAPGKEGLCHVSELSDQFVPKVEDVVQLGQTLPVKVVEIDSMGRINLSHKQAMQPDAAPVPPARRGERPDRDRDRGRSRFEDGGGRHGGYDRSRQERGGRPRGRDRDRQRHRGDASRHSGPPRGNVRSGIRR